MSESAPAGSLPAASPSRRYKPTSSRSATLVEGGRRGGTDPNSRTSTSRSTTEGAVFSQSAKSASPPTTLPSSSTSGSESRINSRPSRKRSDVLGSLLRPTCCLQFRHLLNGYLCVLFRQMNLARMELAAATGLATGKPPHGGAALGTLCDDAFMPGRPRRLDRIRVVIVGQGYVGLPLAMRSVVVGYDVVGYDTDELRTKKLNAAESFIDDISCGDLQSAVETGRYQASTESRSCAGFDVAIVTVPTPLTEGRPDFLHRGRLSHAGPVRPPGFPRGVGVDHIPRHDGGFRGAVAGGGVGPDRRPRLLRGIQPRAHRPRQSGLDSDEHAQGGFGD